MKQIDDGRMERQSREGWQVRAVLLTDHTAERKIERDVHRDTALKTMTMFKGRLRKGEGARQREREVMNGGLGIS